MKLSTIGRWYRQLFCAHHWVFKSINIGHYDYEEWYVCTKCGKEKDYCYEA
jgi:hypothetical protein